MYGLRKTPEEVKVAFDRVGLGKATKKDLKLLETHIETKKAEIREARHVHGIDGVGSKPTPTLYEPLGAIMRHVNGGRR